MENDPYYKPNALQSIMIAICKDLETAARAVDRIANEALKNVVLEIINAQLDNAAI